MAKKIWVYTLSLKNVTGLTDFQGSIVNNPQIHTLYQTLDTNSEIASDGSKALYTSLDGVISPARLGEIVKNYNPIVPPSDFDDPTISDTEADKFKINWKAPKQGDSVDSYSVSVKKGTTSISGSPFTMAGSTLSKVVNGLDADTEYTVVVIAINAGGFCASNEVKETTSPTS